VPKSPLLLPATPETVAQAAALLREGCLVAFPTETVYGLGGDATNEHAIAAIYAAKGRPSFNPLISHIASLDNIETLVQWDKRAAKLAEKFWPGPLTMVLHAAPKTPIALLANAGLPSIAIRFPRHPVANALIRAAGLPIVAPSANASGRLSPTTAQHVAESLGENVDMILDGGACPVGVESTVLDLTTDRPTLLRPGGLAKEALEEVLGPLCEALHDDTAPKSPGMLLSHYAPGLPVRLKATSLEPGEALLAFGDDSVLKGGAMRLNLSPSGNATEAAANLFSMLRELDRPEFSGIAVMPIPMAGLGMAINDRLTRAAAPRG